MSLTLSPARTLLVILGLLQASPLCLAQETIKIGICHFQSLIPSHERYREFREDQEIRFRNLQESEREIFAKINSLRQKTARLKEQRGGPKADGALADQIFELNQQGIILEREIRDQTRRYYQAQKELISEARKEVLSNLQSSITRFADEHQFSLILDASGMSQSGFPFVLHHSDLIDLTPVVLDTTALPPPGSFEAPVIAVVDAQKLFETHPEKESIERGIDRARRKFQALNQKAVDQLTRDFTQIREEILAKQPEEANQAQGLTFSPEQRETLQGLEKKRDQLAEWRARRKQALIEVQQVEFEKVRQTILENLQTFAEERSFDLILDQAAVRTSGTLILPGSLDSNNITREVQEYLREQEPKEEATSPEGTE